MKKSFVLDEVTMEEINEYDIATIRMKLIELLTIENKIECLEDHFNRINNLIYEISCDIEDYFVEQNGNDENTKTSLSIANYKQLVLRNYRYVILEELIIWKNELILELRQKLDLQN